MTATLKARIQALECPDDDVLIVIGEPGTPGKVLVNGRPSPAGYCVADGPLTATNPRPALGRSSVEE